MAKRLIGIDPGVSGAMAVLTETGELVATGFMPVYQAGKAKHVNAAALADFIRSHTVDFAAVEKVGAMPGQGVSSMFNFGHSAGVIEGVLAAVGIGYTLVTPQTWKRHFKLLGKDKDASRTVAQQLYPSAPLSRKKDCGVADAILLARYAIEGKAI